MVNSWPRNTKKETEEKTTERTISTCTDWSHSGKNKSSPDFSCHQVQSCILCFSFLYHFLWRTRTTKFPWSCQTCSCTTGPSSPDHPTPTRTGKRNETMQGTAENAYLDRHYMSNPDHYLLHGGYKQHRQGDQMQQDHKHEQVRHFRFPERKKTNKDSQNKSGFYFLFSVSVFSINTLKIQIILNRVFSVLDVHKHFFFLQLLWAGMCWPTTLQ